MLDRKCLKLWLLLLTVNDNKMQGYHVGEYIRLEVEVTLCWTHYLVSIISVQHNWTAMFNNFQWNKCAPTFLLRREFLNISLLKIFHSCLRSIFALCIAGVAMIVCCMGQEWGAWMKKLSFQLKNFNWYQFKVVHILDID